MAWGRASFVSVTDRPLTNSSCCSAIERRHRLDAMNKPIAALALCCALGAAGQDQVDIPQREMSVKQGPETVFDRPPAEILPALAGAKATGENGRVGPELVFWGYEYDDGRRVFFFACANSPTSIVRRVCPPSVPRRRRCSRRVTASGTTVRRSCRNIATVSPGDIRPGCAEQTESATLAVGLVSCG